MSKILHEEKLWVSYINKRGVQCRVSYDVLVKGSVEGKIKVFDTDHKLGESREVRTKVHRKSIDVDADCDPKFLMDELYRIFCKKFDVTENDLALSFEKGVMFVCRNR